MRTRSPSLMVATTGAVVLIAALLAGSATASGANAPRRPECTITGTDEADELHGTTGPDVLCAGRGNDLVYGRGGDDVLFLGAGDDYFAGGAGDDRVYGGPGFDFGRAGRGDDRIFLQGGRDMLLSSRSEAFPSGADLVAGGRGRDQLSVEDGEGNDRLRGGPGRDSYCADTGDAVRSVEIGQTAEGLPLDCEEWTP